MDTLVPRLVAHIHHLSQTAQIHYSQTQIKLSNTLHYASIQPKALLYSLLFLLAFICLAKSLSYILHSYLTCVTRPTTPNLEKHSSSSSFSKPPSRSAEVYPPSPFCRPPATPHPTFSLHNTPPLAYRPFRYGPKYNITMGLRSMSWDSWIELDNQYLHYHALKAARIRERGGKCVKTAPEAYAAAVELLGELAGFLGERYPGVFRCTSTGISNIATGEGFNITSHPLPQDPMEIAARLIQDDVAIMIEGQDGEYYLKAGAILLPGFWRLEDKFGMGLSEIHGSGGVPGFKEKLEVGMGRWFRRVRPENPVVRHNYFIQVDDELAWSSSIGNEDEEGIGWFTAEKNKAIQHHYFRSERQSLRRLPRTGAIVFTIRTYFHPITEICKEPYVPGRLASAIRSWGDDVSKYKGKERYGDVLLEYLDRMHEEQVKGGLDVSKEEEEGQGYPF